MLRIWLGAIKAWTFQVKAETTSLTLSHPIVPGYCSCWKGKIRAVMVWRVNESWGTLKSRIIWLPHTTHCSHVLAILMQSLLGEGKKNISLRLCLHTEGTSGESRKATFLIKARAVAGFVEGVRSSKDLNHQLRYLRLRGSLLHRLILGQQQVNPSPFSYFSSRNFAEEDLSDKKVPLPRICFFF